jgi:hypothetical protein
MVYYFLLGHFATHEGNPIALAFDLENIREFARAQFRVHRVGVASCVKVCKQGEPPS